MLHALELNLMDKLSTLRTAQRLGISSARVLQLVQEGRLVATWCVHGREITVASVEAEECRRAAAIQFADQRQPAGAA